MSDSKQIFDTWNNETGFVPKGTSYYYEIISVIHDAVTAETARADAAEKLAARYREALELIASPKRSDGTYNRCREACEQLARQALAPADEPISANEDGTVEKFLRKVMADNDCTYEEAQEWFEGLDTQGIYKKVETKE